MPGFGTPAKQRRRSVSRFRHRVDVQRRVSAGEDDRGHSIDTWQTFLPVMHCSLRKLQGTEAEVARQLVPTATHIIEARFDSRVDETMRLVLTKYDRPERHFYIGDIDDVGEVGRFMSILVEEKKAS
jgi:SPP1 family predicted phage head-tail adaptor